MSYRISGEYVVNCDCALLCPCSVDGPPTSKDGTCHGAQVMHISEGTKDGVDLAGIDVGMLYLIPGNVTGGNWTMALVVDPSVSKERVQALEEIFQGKDGGAFGEFAPLIATWKKTERAPVTYTAGKEPKGTIGKSAFSFTPLLGADGNPTTIRNSMLGFAPEYEVGTGSGKVNTAGISFEPVYGEHAQFVFES